MGPLVLERCDNDLEVAHRARQAVDARDHQRLTINGFEVMRALRKSQARIFAIQGGILGEARIVERAFGVGPCVLTEAMTLLHDRLASAET